MTTKPKVCIHVHIEDDLRAQIAEVADVHDLPILSPREALLNVVKDIDGILLTPRVRADAEFFDAAPKLKVLSTPCLTLSVSRTLARQPKKRAGRCANWPCKI